MLLIEVKYTVVCIATALAKVDFGLRSITITVFLLNIINFKKEGYELVLWSKQ